MSSYRKPIRPLIIPAIFCGGLSSMMLMGLLFRLGVPAPLALLLGVVGGTAGALQVMRRI